ncbi:MAG: PKD domain-containing protein, partial [Myxococcota bacterium]
EDFPIEWYVSDYQEDSVPENYHIEVLEESYEAWITEAPCAQLSHSYQGVRTNHHDVGPSAGDTLTTFYYDDPLDEGGGAVLGFARVGQAPVLGLAFNRDGRNYVYRRDIDIVFGKNIDWETTEDIEEGRCINGNHLFSTAAHEIGHQLGMAHSCEETDVNAGLCNDELLFNALMFWTSRGTCTIDGFNRDDIEGMTALYGPFATFKATTETRGSVGLEVCFELSSNSAISGVEWRFGDGQTSDELEPCHVYEDQGQFTVNVIISGQDEACGEWEYIERERALVVVCDQPRPLPGFEGMFTYERLAEEDDVDNNQLMIQLINQADTTTYGCIEQAQWDIYEGTDAGGELVFSAKAWSPKVQVPGAGTYTAVLNLGGPGGTYAEELTFTVDEASGCSALGGTAAGLSAALIGMFAVGMRRRRT